MNPIKTIMLTALLVIGTSRMGHTESAASIADRLNALEKKQAAMEQALHDRDARIQQLSSAQSDASTQTPKNIGRYVPGRGFQIADTDYGALNFKFVSYVRYLNQKGLDPTYTNAFGQTNAVKQRQDIQVNKLVLYFMGWILDPNLRYITYVWTSNTAMGEGAQVAVVGKFDYTVNDHFTAGAGIKSLPGVRSTEGNWPNWLGVDERLIADEFFRPSYTTGIWAQGRIVDSLKYDVMLGNNLSQLGVNGSELDNGLNTVSSALTWFPSTGEFGKTNGFGDFENHRDLATRLGVHFTRSDENFQGQPNTDAFDNVQIRLSDGSNIFAPNLFGSGIRVLDAAYQMGSVDSGFKYRGFSLEGEGYWRWINHFRGPGTETIPTLNDTGFQLQASAMVQPKTLQVYISNSKIFGQYGNPWDARLGVNWYPWKNEVIRWNFEYMQLYRSPVGGLSLPYSVGGSGPVFHTNLMFAL